MTGRARVLVSACLLGEEVRYDGGAADPVSTILQRWHEEGRIVGVCPEVAGGLGVPRPPAEISGGDGGDVLDGTASVSTRRGVDVTGAFVEGARRALALVQEHEIEVAVLKERSPSCGSDEIYDGSFAGRRRTGVGVTTAMLRGHGVAVFGESELEAADRHLRSLD